MSKDTSIGSAGSSAREGNFLISNDLITCSYEESGISVTISVSRESLNQMLEENCFECISENADENLMEKFPPAFDGQRILNGIRKEIERDLWKGGFEKKDTEYFWAMVFSGERSDMTDITVNIFPWLIHAPEESILSLAKHGWKQFIGDCGADDAISWIRARVGIDPYLGEDIHSITRLNVSDSDLHLNLNEDGSIDETVLVLAKHRPLLFIKVINEGCFTPEHITESSDLDFKRSLSSDKTMMGYFKTLLEDGDTSRFNALIPQSTAFALTSMSLDTSAFTDGAEISI